MGLGTTTNATEFLIWHFLKRQLQSCVCLLKSECCEIAEHLLFCGSGKLNETFLFRIHSWYEWSLSARGEGNAIAWCAMLWFGGCGIFNYIVWCREGCSPHPTPPRSVEKRPAQRKASLALPRINRQNPWGAAGKTDSIFYRLYPRILTL